MLTEINYDSLQESNISIPCSYLLRLLAVWQPDDACRFMKLYNKFGYLLAVCSIIGTCYFLNIHPENETWVDWINNMGTVTVLGFPFVFLKWFLRFYDYNNLILSIREESEERFKRCERILKYYSILAVSLWVFASAANFLTVFSLFNETWILSVFSVFVIFGCGWWGCWLTIYGSICHIHLGEIMEFNKKIKAAIGNSQYSIDNLTLEFNTLRSKLKKSQEKLHVLISIPVALHFIDIVAYTMSFLEGEFQKNVGVLKWGVVSYVFGISVDLVSISIKLIPAAIVSSHLHKMLEEASDLCTVNEQGKIKRDCFMFHQYMFVCEQDMGYKILGVKITMRLCVTMITTLITLLIGAFRYVHDKGNL